MKREVLKRLRINKLKINKEQSNRRVSRREGLQLMPIPPQIKLGRISDRSLRR